MTKILIVEDESSFSEAIAFLLGKEGYETRSEEHTSELQSRFGLSYAVFCL